MATEREQLVEARELIAQKKYDQARAILEGLPGNSTAQEWLAKLEAARSKQDPARDTLVQARELVKQQRYDEARALLNTVSDHPKAQEWLAQIDQLAPSAPTSAPPLSES
ncbi:MAG: hypothetical protein GYB65_00490, partial [Chloroflexi bacterium]|nr:hypothetical protein [Chloroflexota bacterium]